MTKRSWLASPALLATMLAASLFAPPPAFAATAVTLNPTTYVSLSGDDGGQAVSVLETSNQTGGTNNTADSLTLLTPDKAKYNGYRTFTLPAELTPAMITSIQIAANYYGPSSKHQTWTWTIYNWKTGKWAKLGNNKPAVENVWSPLAFTVKSKPGMFGDFVGPGQRQVLVNVVSNNYKYDAALDYEAVIATTSQDVTITPPPGWTPPPSHPIWHPTPGTTWQWQLAGDIDTSYAVSMYDIDLDETPESVIDTLHGQGKVVMCYFNPGSYENWREDANQFPKVVIGKKYIGWAGEYWLDIRQIGILAPIMRARLDKAVAKGCDGVEPDNIHGYTQKTGFPLTAEDQLAYNLWLANEAHIRSLSIGLKNDLEQVDVLYDDYDWALNEQCYQYDECDVYHYFTDANKAVFGTEYEGNTADFCPQANAANYSWIRKNLDLDAWVDACWNHVP